MAHGAAVLTTSEIVIKPAPPMIGNRLRGWDVHHKLFPLWAVLLRDLSASDPHPIGCRLQGRIGSDKPCPVLLGQRQEERIVDGQACARRYLAG